MKPRGLGKVASGAWDEAVEILGEADAKRYRSILVSYIELVSAADGALESWDALGRPTDTVFKNGAEGTHPALQAWLQCQKQMLAAAKDLGLTPSSSKGSAVRGRPVGAVSARDRASAPPVLKIAGVK